MTVLESDSLERPPLKIPVSDSATQRIQINKHKISLLTALNEVLKDRRFLEKQRNSLLQSAVLRQHQVLETSSKCEAAWNEKISEAQELGRKYEKQCVCLREKRDSLNKALLSNLDGSMPIKTAHDTPSIRANYKMQAVQLQKDIADIKRRVSNAKFRLDNEMKVRSQLNSDVKKLRSEAGAKKLHMAAIRPQTLALVSHPAQCRPAREQFKTSVLSRRKSPVKGKAL